MMMMTAQCDGVSGGFPRWEISAICNRPQYAVLQGTVLLDTLVIVQNNYYFPTCFDQFIVGLKEK